jgi:uncharacterized protein
MQAVIDTNVIVSGLLNPSNPPGEIVSMMFSGQIVPVYDDRILNEYSLVLRRNKFSFPPEDIDAILETIRSIGTRVVPFHSTISLPDDKDRCFIECALAAPEKIIITGNKKHFPLSAINDVKVLSPGEFIAAERR